MGTRPSMSSSSREGVIDIEVLENESDEFQNENEETMDFKNSEPDSDLSRKPSFGDAEVINIDDCEDVMVSQGDKEPEAPVNDLTNASCTLRNPTTDAVFKENNIRNSRGDTEMKLQEDNEEENKNGKKDLSTLVDNQVQCVNLHCQSGYDLAEAPVFVLTHFGVVRRKNVLQKVCRECFELALKHEENLRSLLLSKAPLLGADFPSQKDDVVVMDSVEEIYEEEVLPPTVISMVEEELIDLMKDALEKYNVDFQIEESQKILKEKYEDLGARNKKINEGLSSIENQLRASRELIYKSFVPKIKTLPALNIVECEEKFSAPPPKRRAVATKKTAQGPRPPAPVLSESHDVVALKEVEGPQVKLPPAGALLHPLIHAGSPVYVMKVSFFGVWLKAKVMEVISRNSEAPSTYRVRFDFPCHRGFCKVVTGKQMAYPKPSTVLYPVGTRVIALFHNSFAPGKDAYYAGVIAEPPKFLNIFRYLVFFDDGYAQYVSHEKILLVCESSRFVYEDIHPDSRDFIQSYLNQYPERPMVKLQKGQVVKTEWNGKWWIARVVAVDGSLVKMHFDADNRTEWIYRGSTRLGPLYSELIAAAARKEQGALSRHRSLGIASLKKRNMPYVEYSVDQDDTKSSQPTTTVSKNVAKKSTASKPSSQDPATEKSPGPPKRDEKIEYVSKGYIRYIFLSGRLKPRAFVPHQCEPSCVDWTKFSLADCKGINPLTIPLFYAFERQRVRIKGKKWIVYRAPCGRKLRNIIEMHRYLRITKSLMGLDLFVFDHWVRVLDEFYLEPNMYCTHIKDISYGHENTPVSCVNEINHSWPSFMNYSTSRIPQEGVNICLDEEFLVCCDCTDDCQDKEKCECWQLTIEGTKLGPGGRADPTVGYQFKRLPEPVTTGIYECNQRCKCASTCLNRVAQHPLQLNLQVFRTLRKGWGLRTLNDIPQGGFICIYAGRLHTEQSANDDGRMYGDEYLAELDYIEVVERFKEGYESEVIEPDGEKKRGEENPDDGEGGDDAGEQDDLDEGQMNSDDIDYVPEGICRLPNTENTVNTRGRNKKITFGEKSDSEGEKEKEEPENVKECLNLGDEEEDNADNNDNNDNNDGDDGDDGGGGGGGDDDEDDEMKKKPSKFTAAVPVSEERPSKYKSVREMFGDGADDCYIMDAKSSGNIGRYLNHSCQPNVFVQNVFVDTHDVRFPWVAFFALSYIKAGTELTWDYNYDVGSVPGKVLYCYCNNAECRGRLL